MASYLERVAKVSDKLGIAEVELKLKSKETKAIKRSVNHVICIDISGSMYGVLSHIRTQLKSRLIDIVNDDDTVTIIWFNSKCGYVCKEIEIKKIKDLRDLNESIDKLLVPNGCTNFFDPIELANNLISKSDRNGLWDFFFMSDGGHNTGGSWDQVLSQLQTLGIKIDNSVICEYGYWADTDRLTQMAETLGGQKIFDKDFESYKIDFEKSIFEGTVIEPRIEYNIPEDIKKSMRLQLMWTIDGDRVTCYSTERLNTIWIPEDTTKLYYLKELNKSEKYSYYDNDSSIYSAIYILSERNKYDLAEQLLYAVKNKDLINFYCNAYGKQKLEEFRSMVKDCISNPPEREVIERVWKPNSKRYCIFDFLNELMSDNSLIHLTHPDFKYNFTTARSVQKIELTDEEKFKISSASTKLKADKILEEAEKRKINVEYSNPSAGYKAAQLVWNNERANVSVMVNIPVTLDVPAEGDPSKRICVDSFLVRNYTIVKDGILNTPELVITVSNKLAGKFKRMGMVIGEYKCSSKYESMIRVNLTNLPIVNKKYVTSVSAVNLATLESDLLKLRCKAKYLMYLKKSETSSLTTTAPIKSSSDPYLKSLGITEKGYTPKTELNKSGDFYMATLLETKIEKFSNLPKIEDVLRKRRNGKPFTVSEEYMDKAMNEVDAQLKSNEVDIMLNGIKSLQSEALRNIAILKFSLIVSRRWFYDKNGFDDNKVTYNNLTMSFVFTEKKIDL